ncbi:ABC transporter permease subunit [Ponticoccus sp. SC2-23]|uniref:carbohydrate ABC transporter permease n=1 Tax=Alexandriicola marinus TaxID=2081710 RepID=UPI000FDC1A9E|nr:sugar ABC transporter permease [Alexandriicola marinus]MBM1222337.1 ABC transporter permease subunit [Ponticoccus sp. SC6-9]MBM1224450.1 ABC transporter permease subunit [Ponticoccus sp. SC6-15]MBM1229770.1 ABC transporter permease subunit [Ponticoccus sp. SC6-38]MBM1233416.1 ABC transporter permease subunit [Ponticoccus sp. SC6-45]MBM1236634.1 ABC transporter permease subunit [Ponticoccus sp. SC6-49]MBM1244678.1 ABC transporter permease subunit [Ponticoccus sp. SC2-64]MBM1246940.1 ABC tr
MSLAGILMSLIGLFWIGGGTIWLFSKRRYRLRQIPQFLGDLVGFPVELAQSIWGRGGVPYALLLPNMAIFGLFTFAPMILNFYVSMTGGSSIALFDRPWVGGANYAEIFDCDVSIFEPKSCSNAGYNFWTGMFNTLWFVVIQVPVLCVAALLTALVVNRNIKGRGFWRAMFFYPVMLSPVVIANIWNWVLHRKGALNEAIGTTSEALSAMAGASGFDIVVSVIMGVILLLVSERALRASGDGPSLGWTGVFGLLLALLVTWANPTSIVGLPGSFWLGCALGLALYWIVATGQSFARAAIIGAGILSVVLLLTIQFDAVFDFGRYRPVNWLVTPNTGWPFFWLVFVFCWSHMGFYMLILLAGLQAIPNDLYEAAKMDATKPFRAFWRITLPLVMPTLTVVIVLSLIRSFQIFDEVYLLTGGGPGRETFMVVQNIYEVAFTNNNPAYGQAAAGSVLMAVVIAVFTFFQLWITRRQSEF